MNCSDKLNNNWFLLSFRITQSGTTVFSECPPPRPCCPPSCCKPCCKPCPPKPCGTCPPKPPCSACPLTNNNLNNNFNNTLINNNVNNNSWTNTTFNNNANLADEFTNTWRSNATNGNASISSRIIELRTNFNSSNDLEACFQVYGVNNNSVERSYTLSRNKLSEIFTSFNANTRDMTASEMRSLIINAGLTPPSTICPDNIRIAFLVKLYSYLALLLTTQTLPNVVLSNNSVFQIPFDFPDVVRQNTPNLRSNSDYALTIDYIQMIGNVLIGTRSVTANSFYRRWVNISIPGPLWYILHSRTAQVASGDRYNFMLGIAMANSVIHLGGNNV